MKNVNEWKKTDWANIEKLKAEFFKEQNYLFKTMLPDANSTTEKELLTHYLLALHYFCDRDIQENADLNIISDNLKCLIHQITENKNEQLDITYQDFCMLLDTLAQVRLCLVLALDLLPEQLQEYLLCYELVQYSKSASHGKPKAEAIKAFLEEPLTSLEDTSSGLELKERHVSAKNDFSCDTTKQEKAEKTLKSSGESAEIFMHFIKVKFNRSLLADKRAQNLAIKPIFMSLRVQQDTKQSWSLSAYGIFKMLGDISSKRLKLTGSPRSVAQVDSVISLPENETSIIHDFQIDSRRAYLCVAANNERFGNTPKKYINQAMISALHEIAESDKKVNHVNEKTQILIDNNDFLEKNANFKTLALNNSKNLHRHYITALNAVWNNVIPENWKIADNDDSIMSIIVSVVESCFKNGEPLTLKDFEEQIKNRLKWKGLGDADDRELKEIRNFLRDANQKMPEIVPKEAVKEMNKFYEQMFNPAVDREILASMR